MRLSKERHSHAKNIQHKQLVQYRWNRYYMLNCIDYEFSTHSPVHVNVAETQVLNTHTPGVYTDFVTTKENVLTST